MDVDNQALATVDKLNSVAAITTAEQYMEAGEFYKAGRDMMDSISEAYDSIIAAAFKAHKEAVAKKKSFYTPVEAAVKRIKGIMEAYDTAQRRLAEAEARRLEAEARRVEEERQLADAIEAEAAGDKAGADEIMAAPVSVVPVVAEPDVPHVEGGPRFRTVWKYRIVNVDLIQREYLIPDDKKIGALVRALKRQTPINGIEVYEERV